MTECSRRILTVHRWLGTLTASWAIALLAIRERRGRGGIYRLVVFAGAALAMATGFFRGAMVTAWTTTRGKRTRANESRARSPEAGEETEYRWNPRGARRLSKGHRAPPRRSRPRAQSPASRAGLPSRCAWTTWTRFRSLFGSFSRTTPVGGSIRSHGRDCGSPSTRAAWRPFRARLCVCRISHRSMRRFAAETRVFG